MPTQQTCRNCHAPLQSFLPGDQSVCPRCGTVNAPSGQEPVSYDFPCPDCGARNPGDALHCARCGRKLAVACPSCSQPNVTEASFCVHCGARIPKASAPPVPTPSAAPARKIGFAIPALLFSCFALVLCVGGVIILGILLAPSIPFEMSAAPAAAKSTNTPRWTSAPTNTKKPAATATLEATIPAKHPPTITKIDFPSHIPGNATDYEGTIFFTDLGGDVILVKFAVVRGNFNPFSFDAPGSMSGDPKDGEIGFSLWCSGKQSTITLRVTLKDEAGFTSAPVDFTFACT